VANGMFLPLAIRLLQARAPLLKNELAIWRVAAPTRPGRQIHPEGVAEMTSWAKAGIIDAIISASE
jgi:hypothetical protein